MDRVIIDLPRVLMRALNCDWDVDWTSLSVGQSLVSEQTVIGRQPAWVGRPKIDLRRELIPAFRALRARVRGRVNAWRVPMFDPLGKAQSHVGWEAEFAAYLSGDYVETNPTVPCIGGAAAGATTITVNDKGPNGPVKVGSFISANDWPVIVTARAPSGANTVLTVEPFVRRTIAANAPIDLFARGVFISASDMDANPAYGFPLRAQPEFDLREWIARP